MKLVQGLLVVAFLFGLSATAEARGGQWGSQEDIIFLVDTTIKGGDPSEKLYLAHKTTTMYFMLGAWFTDDGYVLGVKGENSYYPLPDVKITEFQNSGLLPVPLPQYEITLMDYLLGYMLWIVLAAFVLYAVVGHIRGKPEGQQTQEA